MLSLKMIKIMEKQRLGFVATVSDSGQPNLSPKGTFVVVDENTIAFGEIRSPNTLKNINVSPAVEVNFVDPLIRKGFRTKGRAKIIDAGTELFNQYLPLFDKWPSLCTRFRHIVVISVEEASYLISPLYDKGADEKDVREQWVKTLLSDDL